MHLLMLLPSVDSVPTPHQIDHTQFAAVIAAILGIVSAHLTELWHFVSPKKEPSVGVRAFTHFALATLAGVVTTVTWAPNAPWTSYAVAVLFAWGTGIFAHYANGTQWMENLARAFGLKARANDDAGLSALGVLLAALLVILAFGLGLGASHFWFALLVIAIIVVILV